MVGYYPQRQQGELLYSTTARLAAAIFPGRRASYCAERLLGSAHLSFGFLVPNHVDRLLENIPAVTALSREAVLEASTFYLQSPLLDESDRLALLSSIFAGGSTRGLRTLNARGAPTVLKYCVSCARRHADLGKPAIWPVVPNHHGSIACAEHGIRLRVSDAPVGSNVLCDPAHWIKLNGPLPPMATGAELAIAQDFAWIYAQRGKVSPGFRRIVEKLREAILARAEFTLSPGIINNSTLLEAAKDSVSASALSIFAPQFRQLEKGCGPLPATRTTLHAYSLFAFLAGTSLKEVLVDLANGAAPPNLTAASPKCATSRRLLFYKDRIQKFIADHPGCTRTQICYAAPHAVDLVRDADPDWLERHMPKSLSQKPGRHGDRDWNNRDENLCALISDLVAKNGPTPFRSVRDAMIKLNKHKGLFCKAHGRLPKAHALLEALIEAKQASA